MEDKCLGYCFSLWDQSEVAATEQAPKAAPKEGPKAASKEAPKAAQQTASKASPKADPAAKSEEAKPKSAPKSAAKGAKEEKSVAQRTLPSGLRYEVLKRGNGPQALQAGILRGETSQKKRK